VLVSFRTFHGEAEPGHATTFDRPSLIGLDDKTPSVFAASLALLLTGSMVGLDGRSLVAQGREAGIYEWGDGQVLRLLRPGADSRSAALESAAMAAAAANGVPVPSVYGTAIVEGHGVIMDRVDGPDLFARCTYARTGAASSTRWQPIGGRWYAPQSDSPMASNPSGLRSSGFFSDERQPSSER
jgi:hypothetical protein